MNRQEIVLHVKHHGIVRAAEDIGYRLANHIVFFKVLRGIEVRAVDPKFLSCDAKYRGMFLSPGMIRKFAQDPDYELSQEFLETALAQGDECYGLLEGDELAAYGWYSNKPTTSSWPDLAIRFSPSYMYMYKGFTHARHRGQRLHAVGMTRALLEYLNRGYAGIISYIEWNNFDSLKSCLRMGYRQFGNVYVIKLFG